MKESESLTSNTASGNTPSGNTPSGNTHLVIKLEQPSRCMRKRIGEDCYPDYEEITDRLCYANTLQDDHADLQEGMRLMRNELIRLLELIDQKQEI